MNSSKDLRTQPWKAIYEDARQEHLERTEKDSIRLKCSQITGFTKGQTILQGGQDGSDSRILLDLCIESTVDKTSRPPSQQAQRQTAVETS
jgi:hypothetical protein